MGIGVLVLEDSVITLYRSKLQVCTEILRHLASNGPMNLTGLSERIGLEPAHLNKHMKLLENSGLIAKQNFGMKRIFFAITETGLAVLKMYRPRTLEAQEAQRKDFQTISVHA